ncbi:hypothetical protein vseg_004901 [Gypsophila vaccaria]
MAFKKTVVQRLFNLSRFSTPSLCRNTTAKPHLHSPTPAQPNQNSSHRPLHQSVGTSPPLYPVAMRLFPATQPKPQWEAMNVLRATQVEHITAKLRDVGREWVMYKEFVGMIEEFCEGDKNEAFNLAKMLDENGAVIVMGSHVCLLPHKVAKAIHSIVPHPVSAGLNDPRRKELEQMEEQKVEIDLKADALVRRELWAGLGYMVVQTAAFMRLTFWELSWDVMEPICFYVTSVYFMLGYTFFLRTSKEPSFEGFFKSRFNAKQKWLMKAHEFDFERYNELRGVFYSRSSSSSFSIVDARLIKYDYHDGN